MANNKSLRQTTTATGTAACFAIPYIILGAQAVSEQSLLEQAIGRLPAGAVVIADANFGVCRNGAIPSFVREFKALRRCAS
jgi:hypothetical protein